MRVLPAPRARPIDARSDTERGLALNAALGDPGLSGPGKVQVANAGRYYRARSGKVDAVVAAIHAALRARTPTPSGPPRDADSWHSAHSDAWHSAHPDASGWNSDTATSAKRPRI